MKMREKSGSELLIALRDLNIVVILNILLISKDRAQFLSYTASR